MLSIRLRVDGDLDGLERIAARVRAADDYPTYLPAADYRRFLTRPAALQAWVSEWDGSPCGHVALNPATSPAVMEVLRGAGLVGEIGVIARLLVDPDVRRRGVARALLRAARAEATAQRRIPVLDVVDSHHAAIALYRSEGWNELGRASISLPDGRELRELVFAAEQ